MSDQPVLPNTHAVDMSHLAPKPSTAEIAEEIVNEVSAGGAVEQELSNEETKVEGELEAKEEEGNTDPAPEVDPAIEKEKELWASRFSALSRKEKAIQEREASLREMQAKVEAYEKSLASAKEDPMSILEQQGISFEDLVNYQLNKVAGIQEEETPDKKYKQLEEKIAKMEADAKARIEAQERAEADAQIASFKSEIEDTIRDNVEQFEIINAQGEFDLVFEVIEQNFQKNGEVMDIKEAAKLVESHLEETVNSVLKLKKFSNKVVSAQTDAAAAPTTPITQETVQNSVRKNTTLTNNVTASTKPNNVSYGYDNKEKSLAEAAKLIRWK